MVRFFAVRLAVAILATIALLVVIGERLVTGQLRESFAQEQLDKHRADARSIEQAAAEASNHERPLDEAQKIVDWILARPSIEGVQLIDARGVVVAAGAFGELGRTETGPSAEVARGAPAYRGAEREAHESGQRLEYAVPLRFGGRRYALEVDQDRKILDDRLAQLDRRMMIAGLGALPLGLVVFFLLGGRGLIRHHGRAIEQSVKDGLTGLGNHSAFQDGIAREIASARRYREPLALAIVDIDDFKFCNDKLGHQHGDRVLQGVGAALADGRATDACYRVGGDEFALLLPRTDLAGARLALEAAAVRANSAVLGVELSVGIAMLDATAGGPALMREQADAAAYEAKRSSATAIVAFDDIASTASVAHPDKVQSLRRLIQDERMDIAFQPIWELDRDEILGYEALARPSARYGFDGPGEAFELAERTGVAHQLCSAARNSALAHARGLPEEALLFVNISPKTLEHDMLSGESLIDAVRAAGLEPNRIVLELTEHATTRLRQVVREISRLRELGFKIALDDVGAGNAGLELLCNVEADFVKLDRSIVANAAHDRSAQGVLEAIIAYARRTEAFVIAEGIEDSAQLELVRHPFSPSDDALGGVRGGQGYLLGRPAPGFEPAAVSAAGP
jgi:diguanylate cyclase (GGDEF)-like protein